MEKQMIYVGLITYSWDTAYVAESFQTEDEARDWLASILADEIRIVTGECEYVPVVKQCTDIHTELIYCDQEEYDRKDSKANEYAVYRVVAVESAQRKEACDVLE